MPHDGDLIQIIHAGAAEMPVGNRESRRLDNVGFYAETGTKPQNRSGVLRNIGLEKDDAHSETVPGPGGQFEEILCDGRF
jgi:hypothetical protein